MSTFDRAAGILLHPTSLPGPHGIGTLGEEAHRFITGLQACGARIWQILPLGPVAFGNSPYTCYSAFAGNPLLIDLELLLAEKWLQPKDLPPCPAFSGRQVDFESLAAWKLPALRACYRRFQRSAGEQEQGWFDAFRAASAAWLADYALFMAIKEDQESAPWTEWPKQVRLRDPQTLECVREDFDDEIRFHSFLQFLFARQWDGIRNHCKEAGVKILGDLPIFVALDSADVWTHQELFFLDEECRPTVVAGVPPDYFCATGQLWGNPLYDWKKHRATGYAWWLARFEAAFRQTDIVRIDHFRGFEAYWEVPATDETAENGQWVPGPGADLLEAVKKRFGSLPIVAEDLGTITPEVHQLREAYGLPGMRVLQFAFSGEDPKTAWHAPHNHTPDSVVYSGTHDNDTTAGWYAGLDTSADLRSDEQKECERKNFRDYIASDESEIHWKMIRLCLGSVARTAVVPLQDVLGLGGEARMNRPGRVGAENWSWRLTREELDAFLSDPVRDRLKTLVWRYGRV